jgi:ATP-dependent Clp protease adaptor protein ClpS
LLSYFYFWGEIVMFQNDVSKPQLRVKTEELLRLRSKVLPPYKVVLYDDDFNEMTYVVFALLQAVNALSQSAAERIMLTAHLTGSAVVASCPKEIAELYQERLLSYGLTATIEPD